MTLHTDNNLFPSIFSQFGHKGVAVVLACMTVFLIPAAVALDERDWEIVDQYCIECHNFNDFAGGFAFDLLDQQDIHQDGVIWEKVLSKLSAGMMPPPGEERPSSSEVESFITSVEGELDAYAEKTPMPGSPGLHRLNRREYQNAIRDLLGLNINADTMLPADDSSEGFDNIANALSISPALMQAYIASAAEISRLAVGDLEATATMTTYQTGAEAQTNHIEGMPFGTRGGISAEHFFPLDAEYEFHVSRSGANSAFSLDPIGVNEAVTVHLDGEPVFLMEEGNSASFTLSVPAGYHTVTAAFINTEAVYGLDDLHSVYANSTRLREISINGPFNAVGVGDTTSRRKIFSCIPQSRSEENSCARKILKNIAGKAFRRPVDESNMDVLLEFYRKGRENGTFDNGIQSALARILVDPFFIFRFEEEPEGVEEGEIYQVNDYELASRLSFFIWSSIPDEQLLELAAENKLSEPEVLVTQVRRMLKDPKSYALVENFASQWLSLYRLDTVNPTRQEFDGSLREAMKRETLLLFEHVLRNDLNINEFLNANYAFINERLAEHYGIPNVKGSHFRRVDLSDTPRRGLLGQASILTITSAPNRTSPVIRGTWILENILGTPPEPPPAGVETNLDVTVSVESGIPTIRERLEEHRSNPSCAACHNIIDPLGFVLENYDFIGMWRDEEEGRPVDSSARLWDGTVLHGAADLERILGDWSELFAEAFTEKLMIYALGRKLEYYDMPAVRAVVRQSKQEGQSFSAIVEGIVSSVSFRMKSKVKEQPSLVSGM